MTLQAEQRHLRPLAELAPASLLVVDDEKMVRDFCAEVSRALGIRASSAASAEQALDLLAQSPSDFVIADLRLPHLDGIELVRRVRKDFPHVKIAVLTGHGTIESAVEAIRLGACQYLQKPISVDSLHETLQQMVHEREFDHEWQSLSRHPKARGFEGMLGTSASMQAIFSLVNNIRNHSYPVLILGETGTGKEMVARAIHNSGIRRSMPFVPVDCAALSPNLIESELFGYVAGAFTGANQDKPGLFVSAGKGTLFLDEIGEVPLEMQAKLLRALEEKEVRPVGSTKRFPFGARVITATNRDLASEVSAGRFRLDLYYRLNVVELKLPPLRYRREDIPLLARTFLNKFQALERNVDLSEDALLSLMAYNWPGNVRELENVIQRGLAVSPEAVIAKHALPIEVQQAKLAVTTSDCKAGTLEELERHAILLALQDSAGDKIAAARRLGIGKTTLYRKLKQYSEGSVRCKIEREYEFGSKKASLQSLRASPPSILNPSLKAPTG